ncbi:uncharacterized protein BP5553_00639 [Venustampulla echinocandica]|uniref:Indole-diterpene biosynthesis protein PaxU n=1 Tax=Venustampulla echinocandica TaxID=2656787 RepID=A0A370TYS6_9HELO|nr:uncharacterized protein BP5553_00639 [Venustampulla echinocandica]RDL40660.1 hypothetical protein BP5553_00639 [Venustampulla echinocandica]
MASAKVSTGLEHFSRLNQAVYFHQPPPTVPTANQEPDLILLLGWMGAKPRALAKYAAIYEKLYPSSRILIVTTDYLDVTIRTATANANRIRPVLEILYSLAEHANAKLLLHFFSNGGGFTSMLIAQSFREKTGRALPVSAMVLDSCPGKASYEGTQRAFAIGMPKNVFLRVLGLFLVGIFLRLLKVYCTVLGKMNMIERLRKVLNDKALFDTAAPRTYIYSEGDDMVDWRDVDEHAEEATKKGYTVELEKYHDSGHAAHMVKDGERYWTIIQRLWNTVL